MICLGLDNQQKRARIARYCAEHGIRKVFVLSPAKFRFECEALVVEHIEYAEIIQYKFFYRLLQEIDASTLIVINECLRTQNRYDLTYNCIRHFLNQTHHQIIFQHLPMIDTPEDFMVLFDFDTRSRWKREHLRRELLGECQIEASPMRLTLNPLPVETDEATRASYVREKERLFASLGPKDPHTIPRNLYLLGGRAKARWALSAEDGLFGERRHYIGRNTRLKLQNFQTYKESDYPHSPYTVFEFCHNFIDFSDFLTLSRQSYLDVLVADLKVDRWYFDRYANWIGRLEDAYSTIRREEECTRRGA